MRTAVLILVLRLTSVVGVPLPEQIIAGYATACPGRVAESVREGTNVVIWSFISHLAADNTTDPPTPVIEHDLNGTCIGQLALDLERDGLPTTHLVSIGGWNAPHADTTFSGDEWYATWSEWNDALFSDVDGFGGFDGIDWDLEGDDDLASATNEFTLDCLRLMGDMSAAAKRAGKVVSLVPPESYLDVSETRFDRALTFAYDEWAPPLLPAPFTYHGRNAYAYLLAANSPATYDFVTIQLYESYSHADYNLTQRTQPAAAYLEAWARALDAGWVVRFSDDASLGMDDAAVRVPHTKLVVGLAAGWCGGSAPIKAVCIDPADVGAAYGAFAFRGGAFWNVEDDGSVPSGAAEPLFIARGLAEFLHTRGRR